MNMKTVSLVVHVSVEDDDSITSFAVATLRPRGVLRISRTTEGYWRETTEGVKDSMPLSMGHLLGWMLELATCRNTP